MSWCNWDYCSFKTNFNFYTNNVKELSVDSDNHITIITDNNKLYTLGCTGDDDWDNYKRKHQVIQCNISWII